MKPIHSSSIQQFVAARGALIPLSILLLGICSSAVGQSANTFYGAGAGSNNTSGSSNSGFGVNALQFNTTGNYNVAFGVQSLLKNTEGSFNSAYGYNALFANTTGIENTASGIWALGSNTIGKWNTANGAYALLNNTTGASNTAVGASALSSNTTGDFNSAFGARTLNFNTTGKYNVAAGLNSLYKNTEGSNNTAYGSSSLFNNTTGSDNVAHGTAALYYSTTGRFNTAIGSMALNANTTGDSNIAIGYNAGGWLTTGSNNIFIGHTGTTGESNAIRIGTRGAQKKAFVQGIFGSTVANGVQVVANSAGKLGTIVSSGRFKEAVKPMGDASEALLALQPVTFRYKQDLDPDGIPQFGLIAEEVEKVNPDLVARDADGKVNTVRYEAVNAMLLNEFLKEHNKVRALATKQKALELRIAKQEKQLEELSQHLKKEQAQRISLAKRK